MKFNKFILSFSLLLSVLIAKGQTKVIAPLTTNSPQDTTYGTHQDTLGVGGYMSFKTVAIRNALPLARRKRGMLSYVQDNDTLYALIGGVLNSSWFAVAKMSQGFLGGTGDLRSDGSYSNPPWLTSLAYSKLNGYPTLTINGTGLDISASRSWTVGNVRTDATYANPAWITSLDWSKITGAPDGLHGIDSIWNKSDTIYYIKDGDTGFIVPDPCPVNFADVGDDIYTNSSAAAALDGKQDVIPQKNTIIDTARYYFDGHKTFRLLDPDVRTVVGFTYDIPDDFKTYSARSNQLLNLKNIFNLDTTGVFGGTSRYNSSVRGTKPGSASGGTVYLYVQNDQNYFNGTDRATMLVVDNNGQTWTRVYNGTSWSSWVPSVTSTDLAAYLPLTGGTINGYITMVHKGSNPSTPSSGQSTYYFNTQGQLRVLKSDGNYWGFDPSTLSSNTIISIGALDTLTRNVASYSYYGNGTSSSAKPSFGKVHVLGINATGTASSSTYLRGDGAWATPSVAGAPFDSDWQTYAGTVSWPSQTAPSGTFSAKYRYQQSGNVVTLQIHGGWTGPGTSNTEAQLTWPSGVPLPDYDLFNSANDMLMMSVGGFSSNTNTPANGPKAMINNNSSNTAPIIRITQQTANSAVAFWVMLIYFTAPV